MKTTYIQMSEKNSEHGLAMVSLFCRFVTTQGGQYATNTSDALFTIGNQ